MRKLVATILLVLLPLQWGWAVAGSYCVHEAATDGGHFGHHAHEHGDRAPESAVDSVDPQPADDASNDSSILDQASVADSDCGVCHLGSLQVAVGVVISPAALAPETADTPFFDRTAEGMPSVAFRPPTLVGA